MHLNFKKFARKMKHLELDEIKQISDELFEQNHTWVKYYRKVLRKTRLINIRDRIRLLKGETFRDIQMTDLGMSAVVLGSMRYLLLTDTISDIQVFNLIYWNSVKGENQQNTDYKFAAFLALIAFLAPFWISYSGLLSIRDFKGDYKPHNCEKDSMYQTVYKFLFLSFLGPLSILSS